MQRPEMFAAFGNFSGPINIIPRTPVAPDEKLGQPCLRDDFCEEPFATLWASFGSAAKRRNTPDDNLYMLEKHLQAGTDLPKFYMAWKTRPRNYFSVHTTAGKPCAGIEAIHMRSDPTIDLPKFYMAVGSEDPGAQDAYACMDEMCRMGLDFTQVRDSGKHDWVYCNRHVENFLNWIPAWIRPEETYAGKFQAAPGIQSRHICRPTADPYQRNASSWGQR